jgi:hypothetical protein
LLNHHLSYPSQIVDEKIGISHFQQKSMYYPKASYYCMFISINRFSCQRSSIKKMCLLCGCLGYGIYD